MSGKNYTRMKTSESILRNKEFYCVGKILHRYNAIIDDSTCVILIF